MKAMAAVVAVFADTNLGTSIAFNVPFHITAGALKRVFEKVHFTCLPDIGEIQVDGLMVRRKSCFYYLPDSVFMNYVFPRKRETWFLHVEVRPLKCLRVPCLPHDAAIVSKHQDLMPDDCQNKKLCNSEENREEGIHSCENLLEENDTTNQTLEEKGNSYENDKQHSAGGMPERYSCRFGDKPTSTANKSGCAMAENEVENQVELCANSMQESPSKMSTQVISVSGIIKKYFTGYNGIDSSSSNSGGTLRVIHSEDERSTKPSPSAFEHAVSQYSDMPLCQLLDARQKSSRKCSQSPHPATVATPKRTWPNLDQLPLFMHQFIENVIDVASDGHCGFRAVAGLLGKKEDAHQMIRRDLTVELKKNKKRYIEVFGGEERYNQIKDALVSECLGRVLEDKWMTMPDMGFLIAQKYKYAVVLLTRNGYSETYFPLEGEPPHREKLMCLGWVNRNHFMQLHLKPNCPIPQTSKMWVKHHLKSAENWPCRYVCRMESYNELKRAHGGNVVRDNIKEIIVVED